MLQEPIMKVLIKYFIYALIYYVYGVKFDRWKRRDASKYELLGTALNKQKEIRSLRRFENVWIFNIR